LTAPAATACDLQLPHDVTASCPLRCLQLPVRAHNAVCHHLRDPVATVADLVTLCRSGELGEVRNVGPGTASQIRSALARHAGLTQPEDTRMTDQLDSLTVVSSNINYGGLDQETGDDSGARRAIAVLAALEPDIVLLQEMHTADPYRLRRHLRRFANELGMQPVLGPAGSLRVTIGNHTAMLFGPHITIHDEWPPPPPAGPPVPWCRAEITIPGIPGRVQAHSVHLAARSAVRRLGEAELLASWAADAIRDAGQHVLIGGDFNCVPVAGAGALDLLAWQPRLLAQRCTRTPAGDLVPDLRVGQILAESGLSDLAAVLAARTGDPAPLAPTGQGGARVDQVHASPALAGCVTGYRLLETLSDHQTVAVTLDLTRMGAVAAAA
jgi:endonuclease/exonuclease/phosphatase family metal-dependent hydrolase